ncbi:ABC transporter substrate-binding protein [Allofournierella sp.]|uniref:ABC transporter substrate-binding protein n=1 Tax=Allofournierella sp. TaxID=1940256 RepID=UPI003AF0B56C
MKKRLLALFTALALAAALAGCGGGAPAPTAQSGAGSSPEGGELTGTVTVWSWDLALVQLQVEAEKFQQLHPGVEFQFEEMGTSQVYSKLTTCLQSGIGLPGVVTIEGEQMAKFGSKFPGKFYDFTGRVNAADYLDVKIGEATVGGKLLAWPWDSAPCALYYRTDLFEQAGVDPASIVTWDDLVAAGTQIKEKTGVDLLPLPTTYNDTLYRLMLMQQGTFYFDEAGNTVVDSAESIRAMSMIQKLYQAGITYDQNSWDDFVAAITGSKVACAPDAVWEAGTFIDAAADQSGKWAVMELPRFDAEVPVKGSSNGGSVLAVPAQSESPEAAAAFVEFAMTDMDTSGFTERTIYPSYIPLLNDPVFSEGLDYFGGQPIYELFAKVGQDVTQVNYTENFAEAIDLAKNAVTKVTLNGEDPTAVMQALQKELVEKFGK